MSFRGSSDKSYTAYIGNFLGFQLIAKFDATTENHLTMAMNHKISDHYCGKNI